MFYEILVELCAKNGTTPSRIAKELGISSGSVTWWKQGKIPHAPTLHKIADYFGVSVEYLLGKEAEKLSPEKTNSSLVNLDVLTAFNKATPAIQDAIRKLLDL